jgi:adenylate kinase family enzyme
MNNKIIEIIGPPGVGKTTIYGSLCKKWRPVSNWIYQDALLTPKPKLSEIYKWINYHSRLLLGKKINKNIPIEYGLRFVDDHKDLANFCWDYLSDVYKEEANRRFRAAYFLFADFCRYQAILENSPGKPCILNEGLLQKSFFVDDDTDSILKLLQNYFSLLPMPSIVINVNIDNRNIIVERLKNRNKIIASHMGKDHEALLHDINKWQQFLKVMIDIMSSRGVKIIHVDGERSIEENVSFIKEKLDMN